MTSDFNFLASDSKQRRVDEKSLIVSISTAHESSINALDDDD